MLAARLRTVAVALLRGPSPAALPTPERPASACHADPTPARALRGPGCAHPCRRGTGAADRPQVRRGGDAAGLAIDSMAGGGQPVAASLCVCRVTLNGGGCAAAVLNQWKRLRRSEHLGGPMGDATMGYEAGDRHALSSDQCAASTQRRTYEGDSSVVRMPSGVLSLIVLAKSNEIPSDVWEGKGRSTALPRSALVAPAPAQGVRSCKFHRGRALPLGAASVTTERRPKLLHK